MTDKKYIQTYEIASLIEDVIAKIIKDLRDNGTWDPDGHQTPGPVLEALISNLVVVTCDLLNGAMGGPDNET